MNFIKLTTAVDTAANESDPAMAGRVLVVYLAPGSGGLFVHRVGVGSHQLGGDSEDDFASSMMSAVDVLWPEVPPKLRQYLRIAAHSIAHSAIGRMLGGNDDPDPAPAPPSRCPHLVLITVAGTEGRWCEACRRRID